MEKVKKQQHKYLKWPARQHLDKKLLSVFSMRIFYLLRISHGLIWNKNDAIYQGNDSEQLTKARSHLIDKSHGHRCCCVEHFSRKEIPRHAGIVSARHVTCGSRNMLKGILFNVNHDSNVPSSKAHHPCGSGTCQDPPGSLSTIEIYRQDKWVANISRPQVFNFTPLINSIEQTEH